MKAIILILFLFYTVLLPIICFGQGVWSPDGRKILFPHDKDGSRDIFMINVNGTGLMVIIEKL